MPNLGVMCRLLDWVEQKGKEKEGGQGEGRGQGAETGAMFSV
jgi:hypothetical protein